MENHYEVRRLLETRPTDFDVHLFHEGNLFKSYECFGAHITVKNRKKGTVFTVWAPHAERVSVIGNFNDWDGEQHVMEKVNDEGIWSLFIPKIAQGEIYKYEILTEQGEKLVKSDPFAFFSELRPNTASVVYELEGYEWKDSKYLKQKESKNVCNEPVVIYEVHLGSWKIKEDGRFYTYRELADELIPYVKVHGYTHLELLPIIEHPYDRSWGYQGVGYFSVTSRYGTPHDFMYFVDQCHQNGLGVILDWVPGHFCKDSHGLYLFDGKPTYEYEHYDVRENEVWGTANFDLSKPEVRSFLLSNAVYWMTKFHIDGFRVDAVANILYWTKSSELEENPYAVKFLQKLNEVVFETNPNVLMIAEDSTDWPLVTAPTYDGGLGFSFKWNMGWMNDVLTYMEMEPSERKHHHNRMTFSFLYAFSENFILPFSHDEVVHGKKSLLNKMPGSYEEKFAQLRALYGYYISHPGKKLLFMGSEFGQFDEWKDLDQLDWSIKDYELHSKMNVYMKDLLSLYQKNKALYLIDHHWNGFQWIDANNAEQSVFSFIRKGINEGDYVVIICNFREIAYENYRIGVPYKHRYKELITSDYKQYGGNGKVNRSSIEAEVIPFHGLPYSIEISLPAYSFTILRPVKSRKGNVSNGPEKMRSNVISRGKRE